MWQNSSDKTVAMTKGPNYREQSLAMNGQSNQCQCYGKLRLSEILKNISQIISMCEIERW